MRARLFSCAKAPGERNLKLAEFTGWDNWDFKAPADEYELFVSACQPCLLLLFPLLLAFSQAHVVAALQPPWWVVAIVSEILTSTHFTRTGACTINRPLVTMHD